MAARRRKKMKRREECQSAGDFKIRGRSGIPHISAFTKEAAEMKDGSEMGMLNEGRKVEEHIQGCANCRTSSHVSGGVYVQNRA